MIQAELLDMQSDSVGGFLLQVALLDIQYFVEKLAYMEAQTHFFLLGKGLRILVFEDPSATGSTEFQLVTIVTGGL